MGNPSPFPDDPAGQVPEFTELELFGDVAEVSPFDEIRQVDNDGEFWSARDLQPIMEYDQWRRFADSIERAMVACRNSGQRVEDHFAASGKITTNARGQKRVLDDYRLSRHGAYLTAINGDPRKEAIAKAQTYFAEQTRKQELAEQASAPSAGSESAGVVDLSDVRALKRFHEMFGAALAKIDEQAVQIEAERQGRMIEAAGRHAAEDEAAAMETRAAQADHHRAADGMMTVGDLANKLKAWAKDECGVKILHQEVWDFCRELGLLIKNKNTVRKNRVTSFAIDNGYMREKESEHEDPETGKVYVNHTPRVTPKGEGYIWDRATRRIADTGTLKPIGVGAA
ncbi:hypothetical protein Sme01_03260 [Sphaerisporangium melleum]|uniref:Antirepressor protein C-terminal domain-containing protein n=1 Tax=Sphaerisporangium melleum TaxID=321316 RepID=A0A917VCL1_9ACTN|nr:phage antirepressor KilAC domain-containing protein [Sphaerisporangium melleum]GGK61519.1 hypothetical protein GCM10007964_00800 [Sphaerisporangium melleum]GII67850.1 hypothetical protein Sme01_03260 [Sphaerisporangium melleum]